eukprot:228163_1
MSVPEHSYLKLFFYWFLVINIVSSAVVNPTYSNSTHQYYITTNYTNFQSNNITCQTEYCYISCQHQNGCLNVQINASSSDILIVECLFNSSCEALQITQGPHIFFDIYCEEAKSCHNITLYLSSTADIYIHCHYSYPVYDDADSPCHNLLLYANQSTVIHIDCIGDRSCSESNFYLNNAQYAMLNIDGINALVGGNIYADYMTNMLIVACVHSLACQYLNVYANYIENNISLLCDKSSSCLDAIIYVTDADENSSITINCNDVWACARAEIYCPTAGTCDINCATATACLDTLFYADDQYEGLSVSCEPAQSYSCYLTDCTPILFYDQVNGYFKCQSNHCCPIYISDVTCLPDVPCQLNCDQMVCKELYIDGSKASSLSIQCPSNACRESRIVCPTGNYTSCNISVSGDFALYAAVIETGSNNTMDNFLLDCKTRGCSNTDIISSWGNGGINSFVWNCSFSGSCYKSTMTAKINVNANIYCLESTSCMFTVHNLISTASNANINIYCDNPSISSQDYYGACYKSYWNIYGKGNNNIAIDCNQNDCHSANFNINDVYAADVNCGSPYSCQKTVINAGTSKNLKLNCNNIYACESSNIHCPMVEKQTCHVNCSQHTQVCVGMQVYSRNPTNSPTLLPSILPSSAPTIPSFIPTNIPTSSTRIPTTNPSKFPTKNPTTSPTQNPTNSPTKSPSIYPTVSPTKNPATSPTKNPTDYPTSTRNPTVNPTIHPISPTNIPTNEPSTMTLDPTQITTSMSELPTISPSVTTFVPTQISISPSVTTVVPTSHPSKFPLTTSSIVQTQMSTSPSTSPSFTDNTSSLNDDNKTDLEIIHIISIGLGIIAAIILLNLSCIYCYCKKQRTNKYSAVDKDEKHNQRTNVVIQNDIELVEAKEERKETDHDITLSPTKSIPTDINDAMVICLGITTYDKTTKLHQLSDVKKQIENYKKVLGEQYGYRILSSFDEYPTGEITRNDAERFIDGCKHEIVNYNDNRHNVLYEALFVTLAGHGNSKGLICSDGKILCYDTIRETFSNEKSLKDIPRIFCIDVCKKHVDAVKQVHTRSSSNNWYSVTISGNHRGDNLIGGQVSKFLMQQFANNINELMNFGSVLESVTKSLTIDNSSGQCLMMDEYDVGVNNVIFMPNKNERTGIQGKDKLSVMKESDKIKCVVTLRIQSGILTLTNNNNEEWLVLQRYKITNVSTYAEKQRGFKIEYGFNDKKDTLDFYGLNSAQVKYYYDLIQRFTG